MGCFVGKTFKTPLAAGKAIVRERMNHKPVQLWVGGFIANGVERTIGTTGFALSPATIRFLKTQGAEEAVLRYLEKDLECFADAFRCVVKLGDLEALLAR